MKGRDFSPRNMKILFVFGYPRAANYILPAFEQLSAENNIYYYNYRQMSSKEEWDDASIDIRGSLYERLSRSGAVFAGEPSRKYSTNSDNYSKDFSRAIKNLRLDLAIFDDNAGKVNWGNVLFYRILRKRGIPVIGCQEGSVEDDSQGLKRFAANLGFAYDYCFCIGNFDYERLKRNNANLSNRLYAVGLPCNDYLSQYKNIGNNSKKHILLIPSYTVKSGRSRLFQPLTDEIIDKSGIYELSRQTGLPVVIKEKGKRWSRDCAFKHLESDLVKVTFDESDLDRLVAESRYVLGAPSTLLFKSIQLGIPTAVLGRPYMGRYGVLSEFEGFTDSTKDQVFRTIEEQDNNGGTTDIFIEYAVAGGSRFRSTRLFVDAVYGLYKSRSVYSGPTMISDRRFLGRMWLKFPRQYKIIENFIHSLKILVKGFTGRKS